MVVSIREMEDDLLENEVLVEVDRAWVRLDQIERDKEGSMMVGVDKIEKR